MRTFRFSDEEREAVRLYRYAKEGTGLEFDQEMRRQYLFGLAVVAFFGPVLAWMTVMGIRNPTADVEPVPWGLVFSLAVTASGYAVVWITRVFRRLREMGALKRSPEEQERVDDETERQMSVLWSAVYSYGVLVDRVRTYDYGRQIKEITDPIPELEALRAQLDAAADVIEPALVRVRFWRSEHTRRLLDEGIPSTRGLNEALSELPEAQGM